MTAKDIQRSFIRQRFQRMLCIPNYTPALWWECDVAIFTQAGFLKEYEIKVNRGDFFADAKKEREIYPHRYGQAVSQENKHAMLAARSERGPVEFWYCVPHGLVSVEELPEWAGLIEFISNDRSPYLPEIETKKAPRLHNAKAKQETILHASGVFYYRFYHLLTKFERVVSAEKRRVARMRKLGTKV